MLHKLIKLFFARERSVIHKTFLRNILFNISRSPIYGDTARRKTGKNFFGNISFELHAILKTQAKAIFGDDIKLLVNKGEKGKITREVKLESEIIAPIKVGQKLGEVIYKIGDKEIGKADVVSDIAVEKASFMRLFFRMIGSWFGIGRK